MLLRCLIIIIYIICALIIFLYAFYSDAATSHAAVCMLPLRLRQIFRRRHAYGHVISLFYAVSPRRHADMASYVR